jgi:hypothetical protein
MVRPAWISFQTPASYRIHRYWHNLARFFIEILTKNPKIVYEPGFSGIYIYIEEI